jgi:hypothetical protein
MSRGFTALVGLALLLTAGCASGPSGPAAGSGGVAYREDPDLQRVWVAEGFDFTGYDTIYVVEPRAEVPKLNPDGVESLEWARGVLREQLASALRTSGAFRTVVTREADIPAGVRVARLEPTITEYEKGGGGGRYWAGLYGGGQPVIRVQGRMADGDRPLFLFDTRRSGVGGKARWAGFAMSDKDIQQHDIEDLGRAVGEFVARKGQPKAK